MVTLGAYPTYASDPSVAPAIIAGLADSPTIDGLELPWTGSLLVPAGCPSRWRHVVTCIPATMGRVASNASYGLASPDADGRAQALADLAEVRDEVSRLGTVVAVEVHSAPTRLASADAFAASLTEVAGWDWAGATLVVEHCDARRPDDGTVQKGFLPFADEMAVVASLAGSTPVRVGVNWARSVIESRDRTAPERQIDAAVDRGLMGALFFSSVSDRTTRFGPAWLDAHLAPAGTSAAEEGTLLERHHISACVRELGDSYDGVVGVKVGFRPPHLSPAERVGLLLETVQLVADARAD